MLRESLETPKKARERRAFQALLALDDSLPAGVVEDGVEGEEPDFLIRTAQGNLGIEITEYFTPVRQGARWRLKERARLTDEIAREATRECVDSGLTNVVASVEFDDTSEILKRDVPGIARAIASAVAPAAIDRLPTLRVRDMRRLPNGVVDLWAHYRAHMPQPFVGLAWGGIVRPVDETELLRLITNKEDKLQSIYMQRCSAVWLVVLVDPYSASSMGYVPPDYRLTGSPFDRVIALQGWSYTIDMWRAAA